VQGQEAWLPCWARSAGDALAVVLRAALRLRICSSSCARTPSTTIRSTRTGHRPAETTNDPGEVVALTLRLAAIWQDGFGYVKTGLILTELLPETLGQPGEFQPREVREGLENDGRPQTPGSGDLVLILSQGPRAQPVETRADPVAEVDHAMEGAATYVRAG
jgi:hypothetical protein